MAIVPELNNHYKMKFYRIQEWDYMDEYPTTQVMVFQNKEKAEEFVHQMNERYSGGTTTLMGEMNATEAYDYCQQLYNREKANPQEDSRNFLLNIAQQYKKCYGGNVFVELY